MKQVISTLMICITVIFITVAIVATSDAGRSLMAIINDHIDNHNFDGGAHPYIRQLIQNAIDDHTSEEH